MEKKLYFINANSIDCIEECKEIGKLAVGELFTSHDYGNGAVIVRMS